MAVTDQYMDANDFRGRIDKDDTTEDTLLNELLLSVSRYIDRRMGRFFSKDATAVARIFPEAGSFVDGRRLYLPDMSAAPTEVLYDSDGDYDLTDESALATDGTDYWVGPWNAAAGSEPHPFRFLELNPNGTTITAWPTHTRSIQVTCAWGWPSIPWPIQEATGALARQVMDAQRGGYALELQAIDQSVRQSPTASKLINDLIKVYAVKGRGWL